MTVVYAIPGLGTTEELFRDIKIPGIVLNVLSWPVPEKGENMKNYAQKFADQIDDSSPVNLMGVSFGGMLCIELSEMLNISSLVLISSAKSRSELPLLVRTLKYIPLHHFLSEERLRQIACRSWRVVGFSKTFLPEFTRMVYAMPAQYFRNCIQMIACWGRVKTTMPVYHLHGNSDMLLYRRYIKNCETINGGTHAMIVHKSAEINSLLDKFYNGL